MWIALFSIVTAAALGLTIAAFLMQTKEERRTIRY